jgi:glyoxylase-like metal-dependent hydrolase (beta-lactamase superfamily II)
MAPGGRTTRLAIAAAAAALGLLSFTAVVPLGAQAAGGGGEFHVLPVRGNIYLITGAGKNITASVGKDGVMLVDSGPANLAEKTLAVVRDLARRVTSSPMPARSCVGMAQGCQWWSSSELLPTTASPRAPRPIGFIINTSDDPDDVGGNAVIGAAGRTFGVRNIDNTSPGASVVAHENAVLRLSRSGQDKLVASESYAGRDKKLNFFNGEGVVVTHPDSAHTDGDSIVYFRGSDVLAVGDVVNMTNYPVIDTARGGTVNGLVEALNWILDVCVVEHMMEGGTIVVPGHGRLMDTADVAYYRDMVTIMRDRVREMSKRGMTLEQIKAARPTRDYDGRYGKNPQWTPAMFVEAIYKTLPKAS